MAEVANGQTGHAGAIASSSTAEAKVALASSSSVVARTASVMTSQHSRFVASGDLVIVFLSRDRTPMPLIVTPGAELTNTFGSFPHDDMIGLPFGAKLASRNRKGFIHLLRPTPELWTLALPHRTQILYTPDMSFIAAHLGLSPGARLIEAGTGSGSFSHFAARCVARKHANVHGVGWRGKSDSVRQDARGGQPRSARRDRSGENGVEAADAAAAATGSEDEQERKEPADDHEADVLRCLAAEPDANVGVRDGRVWSFEFHAGRAVKAWDEFEQHGLFPTLSLRHRNVCKSGFGLEGVADAVFLDVPKPWEALRFAAQAMRRDVATRICCFSPCVEQVLSTLAALRKGDREAGEDSTNAGKDDNPSAAAAAADEIRWTDIETYECLNRTHLTMWTGPGTLTVNAPIDEAIKRIRHVEAKKSRRRMMQIEKARREREARLHAEGQGQPSGAVVDTAMENGGESESGEDDDVDQQKGQKRKLANGDDSGALDATERLSKRPRQDENGGSGAEDDDDRPSTTRPGAPTGVSSALPASLATVVEREGKTFQRASVQSRPLIDMRGHTSYLTFATLVPRAVERQVDPTLEREKELRHRKEQAAERAAERKQAKANAEAEAGAPPAAAT